MKGLFCYKTLFARKIKSTEKPQRPRIKVKGNSDDRKIYRYTKYKKANNINDKNYNKRKKLPTKGRGNSES